MGSVYTKEGPRDSLRCPLQNGNVTNLRDTKSYTTCIQHQCSQTHEHPPWFFTQVTNHQWGKNAPGYIRNTKMVIYGGETRRPGKTPRKNPYHRKNRRYHSGLQRPHLPKNPRQVLKTATSTPANSSACAGGTAD